MPSCAAVATAVFTAFLFSVSTLGQSAHAAFPDFNRDSRVDIVDLSFMLQDWGRAGSPADLNADGSVDILDYTALQAYLNHALTSPSTHIATAPVTARPAPLPTGITQPSPTLLAFSVTPANSFKISWKVRSEQPLDRIELWWTRDCDGLPCADQWQELTALRKTFSGDVREDEDSRIHDPPDSTLGWYGLHAIDRSGAWKSEFDHGFVPVRVATSATGLSSLAEGRMKSVEGVLAAVHEDNFVDKTDRWSFHIETTEGSRVFLDSSIGGSDVLLTGYHVRAGGTFSYYPSEPVVWQTGSVAGIASDDDGSLADGLIGFVSVGGGSAISSSPQGTKKIAVLLTNSPDNRGEPLSPEFVRGIFFGPPPPRSIHSVQEYYEKSSFGKLRFTGDVFGYYTLPIIDACTDSGRYAIADAAAKAAFSQGVMVQNYPHLAIFYMHHGDDCFSDNYGTLVPTTVRFQLGRGKFLISWYPLDGVEVLSNAAIHEIGHNLGLHHSQGWECHPDQWQSSSCQEVNFGGADAMSFGSTSPHLSGAFKHFLGWIEAPQVSQSGIYALSRIESPTGNRTLRIARNGQETYYLNYYRDLYAAVYTPYPVIDIVFKKNHERYPFSYWLRYQSPRSGPPLTDITHATGSFGHLTSRMFNDPAAGFSLAPLGEDGASAMRIKIDFHSNSLNTQPPSAPSISGPSEVGSDDTAPDFSFVSSDPDGGQVDYEIDWGDGNVSPWSAHQDNNVAFFGTHVWVFKKTPYCVKARARDYKIGELVRTSNWSPCFLVHTLPPSPSTPHVEIANISPLSGTATAPANVELSYLITTKCTMRFYDNTVLVGERSEAAGNFKKYVYEGVLAGLHTFKIECANIDGVTGTDLYEGYLVKQVSDSFNNPPSIPTITGPQQGPARLSLEFTYGSTDPENDGIEYLLDWGDGTPAQWSVAFMSGHRWTDNHAWQNPGSYCLKVAARDERRDGSKGSTQWSPCYTVTITVPTDSTPSTLSTFTVNDIAYPGTVSGQGPFTLRWTVADNQELNRVELWRAPYEKLNLETRLLPPLILSAHAQEIFGLCHETSKASCKWNKLQTFNRPSHIPAQGPWSGTVEDTPAVGKWWYGIHVYDQAGYRTTEADAGKGPILVERKSQTPPPPPCAGAVPP